MNTTQTHPGYAIPQQQQQHAHAPQPDGVQQQYAPPGMLPTGTPGVVIPARQAALPTEEQMRNPYNVQTDPTRAGSPEQHFQEQRTINPAEQGARLAQARLETTIRMAQERNQYLEQQLQQTQQNTQQQFTAMQQQIAQATARPQVDPLAQYELTAEERELAGDQLGVVNKIAGRMAREAELRHTQEMERRIAELQSQFTEQLAPLQQSSQQTAEQIQRDWGNQFVANVQRELGFDVRALQGDPAWEAFASEPVPHTGGVTYGAQLANFIKARETEAAMELTREYAARRAGQQAETHNPYAQAAVPQQSAARPSAAPTHNTTDPQAQYVADVAEYARLTDQLSRGHISIPDFHRLTKPIDDRLAGRTT